MPNPLDTTMVNAVNQLRENISLELRDLDIVAGAEANRTTHQQKLEAWDAVRELVRSHFDHWRKTWEKEA